VPYPQSSLLSLIELFFYLQARAFKEVILSAGVSKSPQLLMLSGIGPADKLQNLGIPVLVNLTGVGQNYVERPRVEIIFESTLVCSTKEF